MSVPASAAEAGEADEDEGSLLPRAATHSDAQSPTELAGSSASHGGSGGLSGTAFGASNARHAMSEGLQAMAPVAAAVWRAGASAVRGVAGGLGMAWGRRQGEEETSGLLGRRGLGFGQGIPMRGGRGEGTHVRLQHVDAADGTVVGVSREGEGGGQGGSGGGIGGGRGGGMGFSGLRSSGPSAGDGRFGMDNLESLDYDVIDNSVFRDEQVREGGKERRVVAEVEVLFAVSQGLQGPFLGA